MRRPSDPTAADVPTLPAGEGLAVVRDVVAPLLARGVIVRRPAVVAAIERLDLDRRAVDRLHHVADRHGPGPVRLPAPGRRFALVLRPEDARRVLEETPEPFTPATREKRAALAPFQPHGVLASPARARDQRRPLNEEVLDSGSAVHGMADAFQPVLVEEAEAVATVAGRRGRLRWEELVAGWNRMVRRVVLGDGARDDQQLTDLLTDLRRTGNWSVLGRRRDHDRDVFLERLQHHLDRAEPGSLAARMDDLPTPPGTRPVEQVPQWLFAFDAAAWTLARALVLLANHPTAGAPALREAREADLTSPAAFPRLRGVVLDTLRLFPTTPAILRETTAPTTWATGTLPAGTSVLVHAPMFHRGPALGDDADRFAPDLWDGDGASVPTRVDAPLLLPFSAGPAICPGRHLVLLTVTTTLATLARRLELEPGRRRIRTDPLPSALDPFTLDLDARPDTPLG